MKVPEQRPSVLIPEKTLSNQPDMPQRFPLDCSKRMDLLDSSQLKQILF
jgi:hypothetical protein